MIVVPSQQERDQWLREPRSQLEKARRRVRRWRLYGTPTRPPVRGIDVLQREIGQLIPTHGVGDAIEIALKRVCGQMAAEIAFRRDTELGRWN